MTYNYNGQTVELPEWCKFWTEEEKADAADAIINQPVIDYSDRLYNDLDRLEEGWLRQELREEGFNRKEIEEILVRYYAGDTIDGAMQSIFI